MFARQAVSLRRAVELALDASRGLAYMHSKKPSPIVHRDLKPANLMIAGNLYQVCAVLVMAA
jgi:serine/threonine protein kinase